MIAIYLPPILFITIGAIAQAAFDFGALFDNGVSVAVLIWFMIRMEPRLKAMEEAHRLESINVQDCLGKVARATLMFVISDGIEPLKTQAQEAVAEIDKDQAERAKRKEKLMEKK